MEKIVDPDISRLRDTIIGEVFLALGFSKGGWAARTFGFLFRKGAERLARIGVTADRMIDSHGFAGAASWMLTNWCNSVQAGGADTIPGHGPLLIVSNHAGTYDTFVLASQIGREDLKLIASDVPFLKNLPNANNHIIFLSEKLQDRTYAARAGIRHLEQGGALLLYGTGLIDPDPAVYQDAELWIDKWLPSIDLFLRAVPNARVVLSIVSGVVAPGWAHHPITWLKRIDWQKRRLAEFSQVLYQLYFPGKLYLSPAISFSPPVEASQLSAEAGSGRVLPIVIQRGKVLLAEHYRSFYPAGKEPRN
jgi:hypothetical protein